MTREEIQTEFANFVRSQKPSVSNLLVIIECCIKEVSYLTMGVLQDDPAFRNLLGMTHELWRLQEETDK